MAAKGRLHCKRCQCFGHMQRNCGYAPQCVACGVAPTSPVDVLPRGNSLRLWLQGKPHGKLPSLCKVEGGEGASCKASARAQPKGAGLSAEQMDLDEGWNHIVRGGCVVKATTTPSTNPHPNFPPQPVTEAPEQPIETATRETGRPQKPEPKSTAAP